MTRDSVFAIASMTKPMTAAAVMILQDEGKLQLDEPGSFGHGGAFGTVSWADPRQEVLVVLLVARQNFAEERNLRAEIQELARDAIVP